MYHSSLGRYNSHFSKAFWMPLSFLPWFYLASKSIEHGFMSSFHSWTLLVNFADDLYNNHVLYIKYVLIFWKAMPYLASETNK
jgi:hypothetical protein